MKRICEKCGKELQPIPIDIKNPRIISYGRCLSCAQRFHFESPPDFLETIHFPALTLDENLEIHSVNNRLCSLIGQSAKTIKEKKHGEIFGCLISNDGETCGRHSGCASCRVKNAIHQTISSGEGVSGLKTYNKEQFSFNRKKEPWIIITAKVGTLVLLCFLPENNGVEAKIPISKEQAVL